MREQNIFLPLDELALVARQPRIFRFADFIERVAKVPQDMELVEQNGGVRRVRLRRFAERQPHVHDGKAQFGRVFLA